MIRLVDGRAGLNDGLLGCIEGGSFDDFLC